MSCSYSFFCRLAFKKFCRSPPLKCHTGKVLFLLPPYFDRTYLLMIDGNSLLYGISIGKSLLCVNNNILNWHKMLRLISVAILSTLLAIVLKTAFTHLTDGNVRFFDQNFFKISNSLSLDLHTTNLLDPISQHPRKK